MAKELERKLRVTADEFILKSNLAMKAPVWKQFSLIYAKRDQSNGSEEMLDEIKYYCSLIKI